jgi:hypothetical protein
MFFSLLVKLITTQAAKALAIFALKELAKRTNTTVDDQLVTFVELKFALDGVAK